MNENAPARKEYSEDFDFEENNKKLDISEVEKEFTTKVSILFDILCIPPTFSTFSGASKKPSSAGLLLPLCFIDLGGRSDCRQRPEDQSYLQLCSTEVRSGTRFL